MTFEKYKGVSIPCFRGPHVKTKGASSACGNVSCCSGIWCTDCILGSNNNSKYLEWLTSKPNRNQIELEGTSWI